MPLSSAQHMDHRRPPPSTTSKGPQCKCRRHPKGSTRTNVIHHRIPRPRGSLLRSCESEDKRIHDSICGNNRRAVVLLSFHRFPEPPPRYVATLLVRRRTPPTSISVAVTGCPKLAPMATLLLSRSSPEQCCFMRTQRGLT